MKTLSTFQLVLIAGFIFIAIVAVLIFSGILPGFRTPSGGTGGEVVMWGTADAKRLSPFIEQLNQANQKSFTLRYVQLAPSALEAEYVTALADSVGPDLMLAPQDFVFTQGSRLLAWPYESLPLRTFQDSFVAGSETLYLAKDGVLALPIALDPLVLYYNRTALTNAGIVNPPTTWTELLAMVPRLTALDAARNITQSAIALGAYGNIRLAKDVMAMLMLQAGTPIIERTEQGLAPRFTSQNSSVLSPAAAALDFFAQFSDPARVSYTWNRSLPEARAAFAQGQAVFYLGYGSEYEGLRLQNPHLDFDRTLLPRKERNARVFLGRFTAVGVARGSKNPQTAYQVASILALPENALQVATALGLTPAAKSTLAAGTSNTVETIRYQAAIGARAWYDFDPSGSERIFKTMIESVTTGRSTATEAATAAGKEFEELIKTRYGSGQ